MSMQKPVAQQDALPVTASEAIILQDPSQIYFSAPAKAVLPGKLRALSAVEQMFTYFGGDRA